MVTYMIGSSSSMPGPSPGLGPLPHGMRLLSVATTRMDRMQGRCAACRYHAMIYSLGDLGSVCFAICMHPSAGSLPISYGHDEDATLRRENCKRLYLSTEWTVAVAADGQY